MNRGIDWLREGSAGRRRRRRPALLVAGAVLLLWGWVVLGSDLPLLLAVLAAATGGAVLLRRRRDIAAGLAVAVAAAAAPTAACLVVMNHAADVTGTADIVAVLTGYILVSPIPTLLAFIQRPPVISRPINALYGSVILLLGAVPVVLFGEHGEGAPMLAGALVGSGATVWIRQRRAVHALVADLPVDNGWTDLGTRTLPDGTAVHRLLLGRGHAIAAARSATVTPSQATLTRAVNRAVAVADTLGMPLSRVQPIILAGAGAGTHRRFVTTGQATASVIITGAADLSAVTSAAPRRRWTATRRALLTAAVLPAHHAGGSG